MQRRRLRWAMPTCVPQCDTCPEHSARPRITRGSWHGPEPAPGAELPGCCSSSVARRSVTLPEAAGRRGVSSLAARGAGHQAPDRRAEYIRARHRESTPRLRWTGWRTWGVVAEVARTLPGHCSHGRRPWSRVCMAWAPPRWGHARRAVKLDGSGHGRPDPCAHLPVEATVGNARRAARAPVTDRSGHAPALAPGAPCGSHAVDTSLRAARTAHLC